MSPTKANTGRLWRPVAALVALALAAPAEAQAPRLGEVQRRPVITVSLHVGSTAKEVRQVTYSPPPGWYVRSHAVHCTARYGNSSYSVATVPEDWNWLSEEQVKDSYKGLLELAGRAHNAGLQAKYALERDAVLGELRRVRANHHALVVDATAQGQGLLRGGGGIELTVTAELVYVGTGEGLRRTVTARLGPPQ